MILSCFPCVFRVFGVCSVCGACVLRVFRVCFTCVPCVARVFCVCFACVCFACVLRVLRVFVCALFFLRIAPSEYSISPGFCLFNLNSPHSCSSALMLGGSSVALNIPW